MARTPRAVVLAFLLLVLGGAHAAMRRAYSLPFPPLETLVATGRSLQDVGITAGGFRRAAADLAWVQFLQYLAAPGGWSAEGVRDQTLRVTRLDPRFKEAYIYGAGILGFFRNMDHPHMAIAILREGIQHNPHEWQLHATLAAIVYRVEEKPEKMLRELERLAHAPDAPPVIRGILGNTYLSMGELEKSMVMWELILESPAPEGERERAKGKIREIRLRKAKERRSAGRS